MTVIIPYTGNQKGLTALLVLLQFQLHPDDDIYIIDTSKDKHAKQIVLQYGSTRCFIFVEPSEPIPQRDAIQKGLESMKQNKQGGALVLFPNNVISTTFVQNVKKAASYGDWHMLIPFAVEAVDGVMDTNFVWFSKPTMKISKVDANYDIVEGTPFYIPAKEIDDKHYTMDLLRELNVGLFDNELVMVL